MRIIMYAVSVIVILLGGVAVCSAADEKTTNRTVTATYHVPTDGKIMDVTYHPEYDQWWVKCREKNDVTIYTYDEYSKQWGCVVFTSKKPTATQRKPEKSNTKKTQLKTAPKADKPKAQPVKPEKKEEKASAVKKPPETKEIQKKEESKENKWITPFDVLKKGADIFRRKPEEK